MPEPTPDIASPAPRRESPRRPKAVTAAVLLMVVWAVLFGVHASFLTWLMFDSSSASMPGGPLTQSAVVALALVIVGVAFEVRAGRQAARVAAFCLAPLTAVAVWVAPIMAGLADPFALGVGCCDAVIALIVPVLLAQNTSGAWFAERDRARRG